MNMEDLQRRVEARAAFQNREDVKTGEELRNEAFHRLFRDHQDMDPEQFEGWLELLEAEEMEPPNQNLSAGAAALCMMDVRDARKESKHA